MIIIQTTLDFLLFYKIVLKYDDQELFIQNNIGYVFFKQLFVKWINFILIHYLDQKEIRSKFVIMIRYQHFFLNYRIILKLIQG